MNPKFGLMRAGSPSYPEEQLIHDSWAWLKYIQVGIWKVDEAALFVIIDDKTHFECISSS